MLLGKIIGTVVSTQKTESLIGLKLLIVKNIDLAGAPSAGYHVAADAVQAGVGDIVIYATGSAARQSESTLNCPVDAIVMGIVDTWDVDGESVFQKSKPVITADV